MVFLQGALPPTLAEQATPTTPTVETASALEAHALRANRFKSSGRNPPKFFIFLASVVFLIRLAIELGRF